jgi:multiple antibiotic resistance protein
MLRTIAYSFVALLVITDPVGTAALFLGLTRGASAAHRRHMACRGVAIAGGVLLAFAFGGDIMLRALGVGLPAFRIAGGCLLFLLAIDMLLARQPGFRDLTESENREAGASPDISVFPLAIPLIAGPGALTTMVLLMNRTGEDVMNQVFLIVVLVVVLIVILLTLLAASELVKVLGATGVNVFSRVLGILLAALAVQLIIDGIAAVVANPTLSPGSAL